MKIIDSASESQFAATTFQAAFAAPETWAEFVDARVYLSQWSHIPWATSLDGTALKVITVDVRTYTEFASHVDRLIRELEALKQWGHTQFQQERAARATRPMSNGHAEVRQTHDAS